MCKNYTKQIVACIPYFKIKIREMWKLMTREKQGGREKT